MIVISSNLLIMFSVSGIGFALDCYLILIVVGFMIQTIPVSFSDAGLSS